LSCCVAIVVFTRKSSENNNAIRHHPKMIKEGPVLNFVAVFCLGGVLFE
jgi:hypothetical protein